MTMDTAVQRHAPGDIDDAFIQRALEDADLNALRLALYQVTGDESLLQLRLKQVPVYGGATVYTDVADDDVPILTAKAAEFLRNLPADFEQAPPDDGDLRRMIDAFTNETMSDTEWSYRRQLGAFEDFPRLARWTGAKPAIPTGFEVAIIGSGYAGIAMGVQLENLGVPYTVYERRSEVGGTWSRNTYPDVRVDTTNFLYQFFFEKNYPWKEYFARGPEVREYLEHVAKKYGVHDHVSFNSDVTTAAFDEKSGTWNLTVVVDGEERHMTANVVVGATGLFATPNRFAAPGVDDFTGTILHTAECTGNEDFTGLDVAVIGNGSTGVQMFSAVHKQAKSLTLYQRTPQWVAPRERYGDPINPETRWLLDNMPYYWNWYCYSIAAMRFAGQLTQEPDPAWKAQGGQVSKANDLVRESLTKYIKTKMASRPDLIEKLIPDYPPMARRMVVDNSWYATLLEDNVELVTESIERVTPTGIRAADGSERRHDLILTATGYAVEKYLSPIDVTGIGGIRLDDVWSDPASKGPRAYLSLTVPDFPNLFVMYGPNSQNRSGSLIVWMEAWSKYIAEGIVALIEGGHKYANVKQDVFDAYNVRLDEAMATLIWNDPAAKGNGRNYYVNEYGRQQVNVPWRLEEHHRLLKQFNPADYTLA